MLVEAEGRAARFNAKSALDGVQAGALDEMFSQGEPVLAGWTSTRVSVRSVVEPDARCRGVGAVASRGAGAGLSLSVWSRCGEGDCGGGRRGIPHAEQRDDCFHVLYEMNKVRRKLERRAYAAIEGEGERWGGWARYARETRRAGALEAALPRSRARHTSEAACHTPPSGSTSCDRL